MVIFVIPQHQIPFVLRIKFPAFLRLPEVRSVDKVSLSSAVRNLKILTAGLKKAGSFFVWANFSGPKDICKIFPPSEKFPQFTGNGIALMLQMEIFVP